MPQPRRASPRSKERRSRSYSPRRHRSRSRSYSRDRSRSRERRRSPPRKRSPERSQRWSPRHRSQSSERDYPRQQVKPHSGDMPGKRSARRSRTPSPYSRDKKLKQEPSPYDHHRRSPSPGPSRKSHPEHISSSRSEHNSSGRSEHVSSARAPLFPSAGTGKKREIDYVVIVNRGPKMERLNKRFETLEQQAAGPFDFEENITIGIHRGPSANVHLYDDEDVPVNYDFNTKTFKMLHRKKYYEKAIFDRDEIKAFHHDDILDEEAYVEKRTISVKPVDKPRRDDRRDEIDFRVTHRTDRDDPYMDRRMVRSHEPSRSQRYEDIPVTVRLDPKPDPRYERIYRSQQRHADQPENFRDPGDLRNSLLRRKSEGGMVDARSRIDARRMDEDDVSPDRHSQDMDRKRSSYKQDLPDFKNRPGKFKEDWENNPTATPRNFRYFLHDSRSRDDMNYWERKQMYLQTGRYPGRGQRGRGFRARGRGFVPRGRGRGFYRGGYKPGFTEQRTYESSAEPWKHDKYDEDEYGEESESHDKEPKEKKVKKKEKKEKDGKKSTKKKHSDKEVNKEEDDLKQQERIEITIS